MKRNQILSLYTILFVLVGLYFAFSGGGYYTHNSPEKLDDLIKIKIWLILAFIMAAAVYYSELGRGQKQWCWLLTTAFYFVVFYALLFKGTDYGMNGHWGDNGSRLMLVTKFREFWSPFQDWHLKDLPSFYPPLWLYLQGKLAWLFGVEGYKTIKLGYFVIYTLYPLTLYYVWSKIGPKSAAFAIAFLTVFLRDIHLDYVYYEHITAAFFVPWWLYYVEDIKNRKKKNLGWYVLGGFLGALLFMTYYFWFFVGFITIILRLLLKALAGKNRFLESSSLKYKTIMLAVVALFSSIYWLPLLISIFKFGAISMQNLWFHEGYLDIKMPFFELYPAGLCYLIGIVYMILRNRKKLNSRYLIFLGSMLIIVLLDRILNLFDVSIQSRKVMEMLPVFLIVGAGFGIAFIYRLVRYGLTRYKYLFVVLTGLFVLYYGNAHAHIRGTDHWKRAMDLRVPQSDIDVYKSVDYRGKVFLTNQALEAVYLPYYFFQCHWGPSAHTASRYDQRNAFLKYVGQLDDAAQVAFLFRNNCFNAVDYFYLPVDESSGKVYYETHPLYFPAKTEKLRIEFRRETTIDSPYFERKHDRGLYSVESPDSTVEEIFNIIYEHNIFGDMLDEYNRINMAVRFLPDEFAAALRPGLDSLQNIIADSLQLKADAKLGRGVFISDLKIISDRGGVSRLLLLTGTEGRLREDFSIFIHAYPEDIECLDTDRRQYGFANLDYHPGRVTSGWIAGEYVLIEREIDLKPGKYKFHIGLFNKASGTLPKTYTSQYLTVY